MLQDEGILCLWVTGRAMEIGRECLRVWGYTRVDEVVWVKTNQVGLFLSSPAHTPDQTRYEKKNSSNVSFARAEPVTGSIILKNICSSALKPIMTKMDTLSSLRGPIVALTQMSSFQKCAKLVANPTKRMGSLSACVREGAKLKFLAENTTHDQGESLLSRIRNAAFLTFAKVVDSWESARR